MSNLQAITLTISSYLSACSWSSSANKGCTLPWPRSLPVQSPVHCVHESSLSPKDTSAFKLQAIYKHYIKMGWDMIRNRMGVLLTRASGAREGTGEASFLGKGRWGDHIRYQSVEGRTDGFNSEKREEERYTAWIEQQWSIFHSASAWSDL